MKCYSNHNKFSYQILQSFVTKSSKLDWCGTLVFVIFSLWECNIVGSLVQLWLQGIWRGQGKRRGFSSTCREIGGYSSRDRLKGPPGSVPIRDNTVKRTVHKVLQVQQVSEATVSCSWAGHSRLGQTWCKRTLLQVDRRLAREEAMGIAFYGLPHTVVWLALTRLSESCTYG